MEQGLVTVVLPIYNTEKYLDCCVSSVISQTYSRLEILLIDDGSPDNCPRMCDAWAEKDSRIRVIHKQNEGLGMARNTGIENARGEYICFFDSDDFVAPDTIEKACRKLTETGAETVIFGFSDVDTAGKITASFVPPEDRDMYVGAEVQKAFLPRLIAPEQHGDGKRRLHMSACIILYSMDMIRRSGWRFVSEREIISEDTYSLLELFRYVKSVAVLPEVLYYYRTNNKSLSRRYRPNRYEAIRHVYLESMSLCDRMEYSDEIKRKVAAPFLAFTRAAMKQEAAAPIPVSVRRENIRRILDDETLQGVLQETGTDTASAARWMLFFAMKHKLYTLSYFLLAAKNTADRVMR